MTDDDEFRQRNDFTPAEAFGHLHHQQLSLCSWDRFCIAPTEQALEFGRMPPAWEGQLLLVPTLFAEVDHFLTIGQLWGEWHSVHEPDGEWGSRYALRCWPITRILFDEARKLSFDYDSFPKPLADEFSIRMSQMHDHIDMVQERRDGRG